MRKQCFCWNSVPYESSYVTQHNSTVFKISNSYGVWIFKVETTINKWRPWEILGISFSLKLDQSEFQKSKGVKMILFHLHFLKVILSCAILNFFLGIWHAISCRKFFLFMLDLFTYFRSICKTRKQILEQQIQPIRTKPDKMEEE